jgi:four helix bundle protein
MRSGRGRTIGSRRSSPTPRGRTSRHVATREIAAQLYRALGSVPADISEGYSRGSSADRVRFFEYALGSARESRDWYRRGQPVLGAARVAERTDLLTSVIRLLLVIIPSERNARPRKFTRAARRPVE